MNGEIEGRSRDSASRRSRSAGATRRSTSRPPWCAGIMRPREGAQVRTLGRPTALFVPLLGRRIARGGRRRVGGSGRGGRGAAPPPGQEADVDNRAGDRIAVI